MGLLSRLANIIIITEDENGRSPHVYSEQLQIYP